MKKYLYHYTSIDSLLLILKNKTLAFNSLQNVDDLEEADSKDIKQIGKICYVSCWTYNEEESIPMWKMYSSDMSGVRIGLKEFPFKRYKYTEGEYFFSEECESFINYERIYQENKVCITADSPLLVKVMYTDDENKLYPEIKNIINEIERDENGNIINVSEINKYSFKDLGKYKRKNWAFQEEIRYIINMGPYSMQELKSCKSYSEQQELIMRLENIKIEAPYKRYYLELSDEALEKIEILLGPKMKPEQEEMVNLIVEKYCPNAKIIKSKLKIR